jgi:hypothetical protein
VWLVVAGAHHRVVSLVARVCVCAVCVSLLKLCRQARVVGATNVVPSPVCPVSVCLQMRACVPSLVRVFSCVWVCNLCLCTPAGSTVSVLPTLRELDDESGDAQSRSPGEAASLPWRDRYLFFIHPHGRFRCVHEYTVCCAARSPQGFRMPWSACLVPVWCSLFQLLLSLGFRRFPSCSLRLSYKSHRFLNWLGLFWGVRVVFASHACRHLVHPSTALVRCGRRGSLTFDGIVLIIILLSSAQLAVEGPEGSLDNHPDVQRVVRILEFVFTALFVLEIVIRVGAHGFILHRGSYGRSLWSWLDILVVAVSILSLSLSSGGFST